MQIQLRLACLYAWLGKEISLWQALTLAVETNATTSRNAFLTSDEEEERVKEQAEQEIIAAYWSKHDKSLGADKFRISSTYTYSETHVFS